jgi:hypothetical protein
MTMQNPPHPDDELLAAYAGDEPEARADPSLASHVSTCDRCGPLVAELSLLRTALAQLPDVAPSRALRLIPPVPAPAAPATRGSWLRRLTAPAMAAGAALVLVGAVGIGLSGPASGLFSQAASAPKEAAATDQAKVPVAAGSPPTLVPGDMSSGGTEDRSTREPGPAASAQAPAPKPTGAEAGRTGDLGKRSATEQPWLTLLIAGAGLLGISVALRFSLSPRAG